MEESVPRHGHAKKIAEQDSSDRPRQPQRMKKITVDTFGADYPEPDRVS